jgi:hypothetical protein
VEQHEHGCLRLSLVRRSIRGIAGVEEVISYRIYELCGVPALRTHYMHWRVHLTMPPEAGPTQYDGDLMGTSTPAWSPNEGQLPRRTRGCRMECLQHRRLRRGQKHSPPPSRLTIQTGPLCQLNASGRPDRCWYRANMDVPAYCTFQALNRFVSNIDIRGGG